jgi:hypothetical protein
MNAKEKRTISGVIGFVVILTQIHPINYFFYTARIFQTLNVRLTRNIQPTKT